MNSSQLQIYGEPDEALLSRPIELAFGKVREDRRWVNQVSTLRELINNELSRFARGPKNGRCFLQGPVKKSGGERKKNGIPTCYLMMLDHDTGVSIDDVHAQVDAQGLFAVLWHTHSHLKPESTIAETKLTQFMAKTGATKVDDSVCVAYFRERKLEPYVLDSMRYEGRRLGENGAEIVVAHAPMHRVRSLFILAQPYEFLRDDCTQVEAIRQWNELYAGVSTELGLPFDSSCVDPSRLMYLPRIAPEADDTQYEIRLVAGAPLDLAQVPRLAITSHKTPVASRTAPIMGSNELVNRFATARPSDATPATEFQTPWLRAFLAKYGQDFEAADFLQSIAPEDVRPGGPNNGINFACPNEDGHSVQSSSDAAFMATNAEAGSSAWTMFCHHDSCKSASQGDRGWYLDKAIQKYAIADVSQLKSFSETGRAEAASTAARQEETASLTEQIDARMRTVNRDTPDDEVEDILRLVCQLPPGIRDERYLEKLTRATTLGKRTLRHLLTKLRRDGHDADLQTITDGSATNPNAADAVPTHPVPEVMGETPDIWMDWHWHEVVRATKARIATLNRDDPKIFKRAEGGCVRLVERSNQLIGLGMDHGMWAAELSTSAGDGTARYFFKAIVNGREQGVAPPKDLKQILIGSEGIGDLRLPNLTSISRVPIFAPDGSLRTQRGYAADLEIYLDPSTDFYEVPAEPTEDDVASALGWLNDALVDFPFSDEFLGAEKRPIKLADVVDQDGWPVPNPARGAGSRANALAMILQPHVQHLITGSCPAYVIDKFNPGTGAGYLVDVVYGIAQGSRAVVRTMSTNNEEFRKAITATLRGGSPIVFVDNINHTVDSGDLAAALTSGKWRDRILGYSDEVEIEIKAMWIMAGNNLKFSPELMRRNVPIFMDAATPNPAHDRTKEAFKHFPLQDWLLSHRRELVWACHVLIRNWFVKGCPKGSATMNSFDHWASTMSGILEAAGVEGFLSNVERYLNSKDASRGDVAHYAQALFDAFGEQRMKVEDLLDIGRAKDGSFMYGIDVDAEKNERAQRQQLGRWVAKNMLGKTFAVSRRQATPNVGFGEKYPTSYPTRPTSEGTEADGSADVGSECGSRGVSCRVKFEKPHTRSPVEFSFSTVT